MNEELLKELFASEIPEVKEGKIEIKAIVYEQDEKYKVAVASSEANIEPAGTCIGRGGARIKNVFAKLHEQGIKERVDVLNYSDVPETYITNALKPGVVVSVTVDEEKKSATAVVKDDTFSVAIGRKGSNVRLASKLTGYKISIKKESESEAKAE